MNLTIVTVDHVLIFDLNLLILYTHLRAIHSDKCERRRCCNSDGHDYYYYYYLLLLLLLFVCV